jgi:hypothetical protein
MEKSEERRKAPGGSVVHAISGLRIAGGGGDRLGERGMLAHGNRYRLQRVRNLLRDAEW